MAIYFYLDDHREQIYLYLGLYGKRCYPWFCYLGDYREQFDPYYYSLT